MLTLPVSELRGHLASAAASGVAGFAGAVIGGAVASAAGYPAALTLGAAATALGLLIFMVKLVRPRHRAG